jgi:hypothetical protein
VLCEYCVQGRAGLSGPGSNVTACHDFTATLQHAWLAALLSTAAVEELTRMGAAMHHDCTCVCVACVFTYIPFLTATTSPAHVLLHKTPSCCIHMTTPA